MITLRNDNGLVLFGSSHEMIAIALGKTLNKYLKFQALILLVLLGTDFRLQLNEFIQAGHLLLFGYVVGQVFGRMNAESKPTSLTRLSVCS